MTRKRIAMLLAVMVAVSGVLPLTLLAAAGLQTLRRRGEEASREALQAIADQASARISDYVNQQRLMLRTLAMAVGSEQDSARRLADATLDAPSLGKLRVVTPQTAAGDLPRSLGPAQIEEALAGKEVASDTYLADLAPVMDVCVPSGKPQRAVCATLDLLELQRQVQHVRVGNSGYALAFDRHGRLLAAGAGSLRAAVLTGEPIAESPEAVKLAKGEPAARTLNRDGTEVIAGWSSLPALGWVIATEQPVDEALSGMRAALLLLALGAIATLLLSLSLGYVQARKMLTELELEERWRTAGQIASGITHDLGHRLAILQQIKSLSEMNDPSYLPRIRDSLSSEVDTLKRFVSDFADLTREAKPADFLPVELNAFADSVRRAAEPYAAASNVRVEVASAPREVWVRGDRYMLERAALNLTRNAIEASPPNTRVRLAVSYEGGNALLRIEDQGGGIDADRLPTLFDTFRSTKRTGAHVGMGLPNVRRIAVAHNGTVEVQSRKGEGSTFTIALPSGESVNQQGATLQS